MHGQSLWHGCFKDKAAAAHMAATSIQETSKEAAKAMKAERAQLRRWALSSLWIRALTWLAATAMPLLLIWMILEIKYDVRFASGANTIKIELREPPPSQGPRIAPHQRR